LVHGGVPPVGFSTSPLLLLAQLWFGDTDDDALRVRPVHRNLPGDGGKVKRRKPEITDAGPYNNLAQWTCVFPNGMQVEYTDVDGV
jgi:hypothetical protein